MSEQKGQINAYECQKGHFTVTINAHSGTTPFIIGCKYCGDRAESHMYRVDQGLVPTHEWYKPSIKKAKNIDKAYPGVLEHVEKGGLLLRSIPHQKNYGAYRGNQ